MNICDIIFVTAFLGIGPLLRHIEANIFESLLVVQWLLFEVMLILWHLVTDITIWLVLLSC